jgi:adenosylhomocysteinase
VELEIPALERLARGRRKMRDFVEEFTLGNGRRIYLLGEGRLINLAAAEGHPAAVMDMSFANQALASEYIFRNAGTLERRVHTVPREIDQEIARLKLATLGIKADLLTEEQSAYLSSWSEGT